MEGSVQSRQVGGVSVVIIDLKFRVQPKQPVGLQFMNRNGRVYVTRVEPGSEAAKHIQVRDRIKYINMQKMSTVEMCEDIIRSALAKGKTKFKVRLERRKLPEVVRTNKPPLSEEFLAQDRAVKLPHIDYEIFSREEVDANAKGEPLHRLRWPCPPDIASIIAKKTPQILCDFSLDQSAERPVATSDELRTKKDGAALDLRITKKKEAEQRPKPSDGSFQIASDTAHTTIGTDISKTTNLKDPSAQK